MPALAVWLLGWIPIGIHAAEGLPEEVSVAQAKAKKEAGALIIDVRERAEYEQMHIPGALHISLGQLEQHARSLPRNKEIIVVCRSGGRSAVARDILKRAGFLNVSSMSEGMLGWKAAGYPVVKGP